MAGTSTQNFLKRVKKGGTVSVVSKKEFNLTIPRYVDTFEEEEEVDIPKVKQEIRELEDELSEVRKEMDQYLNELGL